ncbi:alanine/glycine:cation symporter family protein [Sphingomicrobium sediminis]|uniref:Alanine:cation symporter family protein n=1 Tax=Sphingomicrobium sediminis TaxID=2950949 RepID=A0A9X2J3V5_9SPHN|nr:amino acid carrier protein [Sphingomicrobium sediminis]MCM8556587.1 alanine:cation symporter family protein [Sphingomicrobium sediminis]
MELVGAAIDALYNAVFYEVTLFGEPIGLIVLWLAIPMIFTTVGLGFINFRALGHAVSVVRGRFSDTDPPGAMSPFQALSTALSSTIGLGNIAGVAIAIATGGPGAAFWMFVIGWFAMSLKFSEVTLGLRYREVDADGTVRGGPMYTLKNGLKARGLPRLGLAFGGLWAFVAVFGNLPMLQVNQSFSMLSSTFNWVDARSPIYYGIFLAITVGLVIFGGAARLGRITSAIVPSMGIVYLSGILAILAIGWAEIPGAIALIVSDAFTAQAAGGGVLGIFIIGMRRAVYSTEAGLGNAVIAHSQAKTDEPVSEGMVSLLEPFIDTVVICTLGALAIVVAGTWTDTSLNDIQIVGAAFAQLGDWAIYLLTLAVFLFAFSTICATGFYGQQSWSYLFGTKAHSVWIFRLLFLGTMPVAASLEISQVVNFVDSSFFLMGVPNILAIYLFWPELRAMVKDYWARKVKPAA